ncbi:VRR-NUC domain-containing protein [Mesorhizobium sp. BR1-1-7]|uniref:VRR-NUC domain-containing protein n=1 Tax=Mesorhizobium sp. BR1-1-7 TaxID=2876647 RepID=UPI001CCA5EC9|nr:VRR-NUC domain-containing protein [Mesorhizobium sp. BR1-1-7]MBZ9921473.1 VRR-NUC domain-containing protein [Mesorhizobium sp. BR1-1-7]
MTRTQQTIRLNGKRTILTTQNGKVTAKPALPQEWELQAAQIRALRALPEYGERFLLAGDQNSAKRGPRAQAQAVAAGMTPGEADVRIYLDGGRLRMIENKVGRASLTDSQKVRHPALAKLGHNVIVLRAVTCEDAASQAVALVRGWLAAADNDNARTGVKAA